MKKQFAVIGLGRFGSSVAKALSDNGVEVLAIDTNEHRVQGMSSIVTHAVQADATDEEVVRSLGLRNFEVVVVAIGQDIQSSIMASLILKELGVPKLIVKAQNDLHGKVLTRIGADKIVYPERDMGYRVAHHLMSPNILDYIELSEEHAIIEIQATDSLIGKSLLDLNVRAKYHCNVIAIKHGKKMNISPTATDLIGEKDVLVVVGRNENLRRFEKLIME